MYMFYATNISPMNNYFVNVVTELGEELTVYVVAADVFDAEDQAQQMVENGEVECVGCTVVDACAFPVDDE